MFVMTAKVNKKKIIMALAAAAVLIVMLIMVFGGGEEAQQTAAPSAGTNDGRIKFLTSFGWEVASSPTESGQVKIPDSASEVFERYNALQKSQGYDLSRYAGKTVMRYVYKIKNYPGATEPVYATLLIYKDQIIGGDVTDTGAKGVIRGFKMSQAATPQASVPQASTPETTPTTSTIVE